MSEINAEISDKEPVSSETKSGQVDESHPMIEFTHNHYTVGWVCALSKEQTAATAMLEEIHPDLPKPSNDPNTYTLGSISKHNIVIACLPKGKVGITSAATIATQMVGTFPAIKVGLMVGIGGGIPPKVRLGDVVVSTPVDQYPGVVQWDFGKAEKDGKFKRIGALNNPPSALLTALTKLETKHEMRGSKIPQYLDDLEKNWPNLVPKYTRSDSLEDPLFTPDSSHRTRSRWQDIFSVLWETILALLGYLLAWWVFDSMDRWAEQVTIGTSNDGVNGTPGKARDMRVHYGLIASGNQVIKDAKFRDSLNESFDGNVLCVEMEAAGLMNDFPCIVIRGICDYADSQKNKDWQEHAAAIAAACAKELLEYVQPSDVDGERPVKDILGQG
jgi:nucleoside phosphorylase